MTGQPRRAPRGDLSSFERRSFTHDGTTRDVYHKGRGPAVIVVSELPGVTPRVLGFADRVAAIGCSVSLPVLFGEPGRDPQAGGPSGLLYGTSSVLRSCVSRDFTVLASGQSSPIVDWLRGLVSQEHARCGGPGVGVVSMCFTGGFALALATAPEVLAPVMSQPSLPFAINRARAASIDCSADDLSKVKARCAHEGLRVLGLRFRGDPMVPEARFQFLKERLGDGFVAIELAQSDGHPQAPLPRHHSVLTEDLIDEPGSATLQAAERVLDLFRDKLLR